MLRADQNGIGKALRSIREELDLTQSEFGEMLSTAKATVCRWELGDRSIPLSILRKAAIISGTTIQIQINPDGRTKIVLLKPLSKLQKNSDKSIDNL